MDQKISDTTQDFFIEKLGDTITVQLEVTKDAESLIGELMQSLNKDEEWKPGLKVRQIYFKGKDPSNIVNQSKREVLMFLERSLAKMSDELKNEENETISSLT